MTLTCTLCQNKKFPSTDVWLDFFTLYFVLILLKKTLYNEVYYNSLIMFFSKPSNHSDVEAFLGMLLLKNWLKPSRIQRESKLMKMPRLDLEKEQEKSSGCPRLALARNTGRAWVPDHKAQGDATVAGTDPKIYPLWCPGALLGQTTRVSWSPPWRN